MTSTTPSSTSSIDAADHERRGLGRLFWKPWSKMHPRTKLVLPATSDPSPNLDYWSEVLKVMQDVWKNEETRFSNLNTRAVAVVTASTAVTTIIGFFAKDLFAAATKDVSPVALETARWATLISLVLFLGVVVLICVFVLMPGGRGVFGNNDIGGRRYRVEEGDPPRLVRYEVRTPAAILSKAEVDRVASIEYAGLYNLLVYRNTLKAYWLTWAYAVLMFAVASAGIGFGAIIFNADTLAAP